MTKATNVWGQGYRVFLSHVAEEKQNVTQLKTGLELYGVSAFVAHADIHPTAEWQEEIKEALYSMQAFVALLSDGFQKSPWTDQETGYALCRKVPIIPVRISVDPYGFLGKVQGLSCPWQELPLEIVTILIKKDSAVIDSYISAVEQCESYDNGNKLAVALDNISSLTPKQSARIMEAYNSNPQVYSSWGFNGTRPHTYGDGLLAHLTRITGNSYIMRDNKIEVDESVLPW